VAQTVDVVVIGAGPAGEVAAGRLGEAGLDVVIVERELVGGECSYWACMPSKALLRPDELLAETRRVPGVEARDGLDVAAVLARRDEVIHDLDDSGQLPWLDSHNVRLVRGVARLEGETTVRVGDEVLEARRAVILAPGSLANVPPIPGLREAEPWTNREVTTASAPPEHLVIIGGGVVGVEMAQAWRSLGSRVTVVEREGRLIPRHEEFAADQVREALEERGVRVLLGESAAEVRRDGEVTVRLESGELLRGDQVLVALGRRPATADLGVETVGLTPGDSIEVDGHMRVPGRRSLYAVGDVNGRAPLTHMGKYQARIAADCILSGDAGPEQDDAITPRLTSTAPDSGVTGPLAPQVIFTDPQVAAVGHTMASAEEAGLRVRAYDRGTSANAGGSFYGRNAPGTTRFIIDEDRRVLVGATFTGAEVADFLHAATVAIVGQVPLERLWHAVPSFPTRSEVWLRLTEDLG
jgi:pyruvate/2-oxoglutarate dehydrogenase complex dihydrolipoamide dehydrogenase (E3) component